MTDLPVHPREYESDWQEGFEETLIWITCPSCKNWWSNPTSWGDIDSGDQHKCKACGYEWVIA